MATKLWKMEGRSGGAARLDLRSRPVFWLMLVSLVSAPVVWGLSPLYAQDANATAEQTSDEPVQGDNQANQNVEEQPAGEAAPTEESSPENAPSEPIENLPPEQPPAEPAAGDQPAAAPPAGNAEPKGLPQTPIDVDNMTQEQIDAEAERLIKQLDEELVNNPDLAREAEEIKRRQLEEDRRHELEHRRLMREKRKQQESSRAQELEAEQAAVDQSQEQGAPLKEDPKTERMARGEEVVQPVPLPSRSGTARQPAQVPDSRRQWSPRSSSRRPEITRRPATPATAPAAPAPEPAPEAQAPVAVNEPPAPPPDNMALNAQELPDVSDAELNAVKSRIAGQPGRAPAAATRPARAPVAHVPPPVPQPASAGPQPAPTAGLPVVPQTNAPDLKAQPKWWVLKAEERPYFFAWKNVPLEKACQDLAEMSGLSVKGLSTIQPGTTKPLTFQSVKIMDYDEALLTFNLLIEDQEYWLLRREQYLEIRLLAEWFRYISPSRMFSSVDAYRQAKVPGWDLVSVVYEPKHRSAAVLQSAVVSIVPVNATRVSVLPNTNLIEMKSFAHYVDIQLEYLAKVDVDLGGDGREFRVYSLKYVTPVDAAGLLRLMLPPPEQPDSGAMANQPAPSRGRTQPPPQPTPTEGGSLQADAVDIIEDTRLNQLQVKATPANHKLVADYLAKYIDLPLDGGQSELIKVQHATPSELVEMIRPMLAEQQVVAAPVPPPSSSRRPGSPPPQPPQPNPPAVVRQSVSSAILTPIDYMHAILVKAKPDDMAQIKKFVEMLDVPQPEATYHYITLQHGSASAVASVLNEALSGSSMRRSYRRGGGSGGPEGSQQFNAIADMTTDKSLIITGEPRDVEEAKTLIAKLDVDPQAGATQHLMHLKSASPSSVMSVLQSRFGGGSSGGGYSRGRHYGGSSDGATLPQFIADDDGKILIVVCDDKEWAAIEGLAKELDASAEVANTTKLYRLKYVAASTLAGTLSQSFGVQGRGYRGSGSSSGPTFLYEQEGNVLLVTADDETQAKVAQMVEQLDQPTLSTQAELRVIELEAADAEYVAEKLQELLGGDGGGRNYRSSGYGSRGGGGPVPKPPVNIVPEPVGNRILITSSEEDFKKAEEFARQLDKEYAAQEIVRQTFVLEHAQPAQIRTAVEAMFGDEGGGRSSRHGYHSSGPGSSPGAIKIADSGSTLVVSAPKAKMEEIAAFIKTLDTDPSEKNEIRTYKVAGAGRSGTSELARTLSMLYAERSSGRYGAADNTAPKFIGSMGSDLLLVSAPPERMEEISKTVEQMVNSQSSEDLSLIIRSYDVKQALPQDVAEMIEPILEAKYRELQEQGRGGGYGGSYGMAGPQVTPYRTGSRILVAAPKALLPLIEELIAEFDKPATESTMVIVSLMTAKAEDIADVVQQQVAGGSSGASSRSYSSYRSGRHSRYSPYSSSGSYGSASGGGGGELVVTPVPSSNLLILKGPEDKVAEAQQLIKELDAKARPDGPMIKVYELKYADTYDVTTTIEEIVGGGSSGSSGSYGGFGSSFGGGYGRSTSSSGSSGGVIVQSESGNKIVVSAPAEKIPLIDQVVELKESLAKEMQAAADTGATGELISREKDGSITKAYEVKGSSDELAQYLDKILIDRYGYYDSPYVKSFPFANQVIVTGKPDQFKEVEKWLEKLESTKLPTRLELKFVRVKPGNAGKIVEMLKQYAPIEMQEKINATELPKLSARRNPMEMIREVRYDDPIKTPESTAEPTTPFILPNAALRLGESLTSLAWAQGVKITVATQPAGGSPAATRPAAVAAPATQPAAALAAPERAVKVVKLRNRAAEEVAVELKAYVDKAAASGDVAMAQLQRMVSITGVDPDSNTLTVSYAPQLEPLVNSLVAGLDRAAATQPAPAAAPAPAKPEAEAPKPAEAPRAAAPAPTPTPAEAESIDTAAIESSIESAGSEEMARDEQTRLEIQRAAMQAYTTLETQIKYDEENGLIYVVGPAGDLEKLRDVLDRVIDQVEEIESPIDSDVKVFQLRYVDPTFAQAVLEQMFNEQTAAGARATRQPGKEPQKTPAAGQKDKEKAEGGEEEEGAPGAKRREKEEQAKAEREQQPKPGGQRIRVFPNTRDQTLVVRASKEDFPLIAELLLKIDRPTDRPPVDIQIFQLKHLNAGEVEEAIKTILKIDTGLRRSTLRRPMVGRSMAPGMMGMDMMMDQLEQEMLELQAAGLLGGLEQPVAGAEGQPGQGADKGTLKLNPAKDITIASDATTNSIMVMAPQEGMRLVKKLIDTLEEQDIPTKIEPFQLQHADATKVATELEKLFQSQGGSRGGSGLAARLTGFRPSALGTITVASDARTNTIVVRALEPDMEKVRPIVKELDHPPSDQQVQIYSIEHGDAKAMATTLQAIFVQDPNAVGVRAVRITADVDTNSIVVSAPEAQQKIIAERIKLLDTQVAVRVTPKQIQLAVANPSVVAAKLLDIFVGKRGGRSGKNEITIVGDDSSKLLFITAPPEVYVKIEEMAKMMDKSATQDIKVFQLKHANATEVLARFREMMGQIFQQLKGNMNEVFAATADDRLNALIVAGTPAIFQAVEKVLVEIDAPPADTSTITTQMFPLVRGNSGSLAATINAMYANLPRTGGNLPPRASAEPVSNVLYVTGTKAQIEQVRLVIIDPLEKATDEDQRTTQSYPLKYAEVYSVVHVINSRFERNRTGSLKEQVQAFPEVATNSVVVTAASANHERIKTLIEQLDQESSGTVQQDIVRLTNARAEDLAVVVRSTYQMRKLRAGELPPTITPDSNSNSLVVSASQTQLTAIKELVGELDKPVDAARVEELRVIPLQYADATEAKTLLSEYLRPPGVAPGRGTGELMNGIRLQASPAMNALVVSGTSAAIERVQQLVATVDKEELVGSTSVPQIIDVKHTSAAQLAITLTRMFTEPAQRQPRGGQKGVEQIPIIMADDATNTLVVKARAIDFNNIKATAEKLDTERAGPSGVEVIQVSRGTDVNSLAREIERTINTGERLKALQQPGYKPASVAMGVDERTPALILAGSPELFPTVKQLVEKLQGFKREGGYAARVVPVKNIPAQDVKRVIQQLIDQQQGQQGGRPRR